MGITIENPTAEEIYEALKQVPESELERLRAMLMAKAPTIDEGNEWRDEDLGDLDRATAKLIDQRFGPEAGNYD
jgi:hypothetical protein